MYDFSSEPVPPHLSPSPQPEQETDSDRPPIPPLRKSIFPHPQNTTWHVNVVPYSPAWPSQFDAIAAHLRTLFEISSPPVAYSTIEHIGSTAVSGLAAKPNIDVLATFDTSEALEVAIEALNWEIPKSPPFAKYTQCPRGGGIPGRESYKIYLSEDNPYYTTTPERSLYLIADTAENKAGRVQIRCYRTVRDILRTPEHRDLLEEYARVKLELSKKIFSDATEYSARKDGIIRQILIRGGWTQREVEEKETFTKREWVVDAENPY